MGSWENINSDHSANQIAESSVPELSNFCISTLTDYLDGLTTEDRTETGKIKNLSLVSLLILLSSSGLIQYRTLSFGAKIVFHFCRACVVFKIDSKMD